METQSLGCSARLITYDELRHNGWSKGMVRRFLGMECRAYPFEQVANAESHPQFIKAYRKAMLAR